jgi:tryptophan synthase alpha chain
MSRIAATFERLQAQSRKALIPYVTAGYPYADITPALMHVLVEAGADVIELGVPFSDPSADGPTIQAAGEQALRQGIGLPTVLKQVSQFRQTNNDTPVVLMGYANPIERYDTLRHAGAFAEDAAKAGVDGVLVVDYPPEASETLAAQLRQHNIDLIFLLAPTSTEARIQQVAERASGYVYGVSMKGVTGAKTLDTTLVQQMLSRLRRHVHIPIGIGFGIRNASTARTIAQMADAVVIGSWLIESLANKPAAEALAVASDMIRDIRHQLDLDMPKPVRSTKQPSLRT